MHPVNKQANERKYTQGATQTGHTRRLDRRDGYQPGNTEYVHQFSLPTEGRYLRALHGGRDRGFDRYDPI